MKVAILSLDSLVDSVWERYLTSLCHLCDAGRTKSSRQQCMAKWEGYGGRKCSLLCYYYFSKKKNSLSSICLKSIVCS